MWCLILLPQFATMPLIVYVKYLLYKYTSLVVLHEQRADHGHIYPFSVKEWE